LTTLGQGDAFDLPNQLGSEVINPDPNQVGALA
jgi:hypothetical protein